LVCCFAAWQIEGFAGIAAAAAAAAVEEFAAAVVAAAEERRTVGAAVIAAGSWEVFVAVVAACCFVGIAVEAVWRFEAFLAAEAEPAAAAAAAEEAFVVAAARVCLPAVSGLAVAVAVERTAAAREIVAAAVPF
jgi:hypothetical protein